MDNLKMHWRLVAGVVMLALVVLFLLWVIFILGAAPTGGYG